MIKQILTNKKWLFGIAGGAIVLVGGAAMVATSSGGGKSGKYDYETVTVDRGSVSRVVSASGAVQPREKVPVGSEVSGKIVQVLVDYNDHVTKGQVLAQVDPETFQNTLDQSRARELQSQASVDNAQATIDKAQVALDKAEKDYTRQKALYAEQAIAQSAMETAEQNFKNAQLSLQSEKVSLKSAQAGLATARATTQDSRTKLERTKILSPIDGVIIDRKVERGQTVQSSQQVATLFQVAADLSEIQIEAAVVESDIGGVDPGDPVRFTVDAFPGDSFRGQVVQVRKLGTEQANVVTYTVVVNAQNPGGKLLPGMTANVEITADQATNVLRIAANATKFQPPKEILEAMGGGQQRGQGGQGGQGGQFPGGGQGAFPGGGGGGQNAAFAGGGTPEAGGQNSQGGNRGGGQSFQAGGGGNRGGGQGGGGNRGGGQGGQGGGGNRGGGGGNFGGQGGNPTGEWLKEAGIDDARAQKIMAELQTEQAALQTALRAQMPQQQAPGGGILGGGNFGPPQNMQQQAMMQEMRGKMQAAQDKVLKANLNEEEYAKVAKVRAEMQNQKPVMVYKVNDKGELERHQLRIGLSDGNFAQVIRGANEGDKFVIRAVPKGGGAKKPASSPSPAPSAFPGGGPRPGGPGFGG